VDHVKGHVYWSQKGPDNANLGMILRAGLDLPAGEAPDNRSDVEVLFKGLPEPIDLEIDAGTRTLYWTDRGDAPRGNTVNRTPLDTANGAGEPEILTGGLMEGIGIALDPPNNRMFVTDFGGNIYVADLDGKNKRVIAAIQGNLTGIAYAEVPVHGAPR
jgi:DNA-binding beta-propeller fold protein YncE